MKQMLILSRKFNKPVLPFVWHRYHPSNKQIGLQLIPINEFEKYIASILHTSYKGTKASGIVWWGEDQYDYNVKSKELLTEFQQSGQRAFAFFVGKPRIRSDVEQRARATLIDVTGQAD